MCPPIKSHRLNLTCTRNNQSVSCQDDIKPGTIVKYFCKEHYKVANLNDKYNNEAICQKNGAWSSEILKCEPKCGYLKEALPLIVNGFSTSSIFPWHATIFIKRENDFQFSCGGTLITEFFVLSAAHCFHGLKESDVKVAIAKKFSNISINEAEEPNAIILNVSQILQHPLYLDKIGNYGQDIALVVLSQRISLSDNVHPVCIDYKNDYSQKNNQTGIVLGMGVTENETFSEMVRMANLRIISSENCVKSQPKDFQKYITVATFCAGLDNGKSVFMMQYFYTLSIHILTGTSACNGDSGNGIVVLSEDMKTWKIQGIVSLSPRKQSSFYCDSTKYTVFTKILTYGKWIKSVIENFDARADLSADDLSNPIL
jgi:secreted trypsin-like serine protease